MGKYYKIIADDAACRMWRVVSFIRSAPPLLVLGLLSQRVSAASDLPFTPVQTLSPSQALSVDQANRLLDFKAWVDRGMRVRGDSGYQCLANLTAALDLVGQLRTAEYKGASGALTLLPTAGALLGAPTQEMWIVYKLVPLAGVLSMFLSLGGSITPSNVGDYDPAEPFSYGGFMPTAGGRASRTQGTRRSPDGELSNSPSERAATGEPQEERPARHPEAARFAREVFQRAHQEGGGDIKPRIFLAMAIQFILIVSLLVPMWYAQRGAVIIWWCRVWGWMYFWYFLVTAVSILSNIFATPFTQSWTIRVSRRPPGIILNEEVNKITTCDDRSGYRNALEAVRAGPNINQHLRISANTVPIWSRTCFYVVISVKGISRGHAIAQVFCKASSIAVYVFGTALFASATLMSISIALMVLCVLLACGYAGRVIAMWIVAQIGRENKPILHRLVNTEDEAGEFFHAIAEQDLQLEIGGHVIISGWCIKSRHAAFSAASYIGLLAKPFDPTALAKTVFLGNSHTHHPAYEIPSFQGPSRADETASRRGQRPRGSSEPS